MISGVTDGVDVLRRIVGVEEFLKELYPLFGAL